MNKTIALYGSRKIQREYCKECRSWAFVIENKIQCCDAVFNEAENKKFQVKRMTTLNKGRKRPSKEKIKQMLDIQNNRCIYCEIPFGTAFIHPRLDKLRFTCVCLDHFIPYSYLKDNKLDNFLCACQICNGIKTNKMFDSVEDARAYIKYRRLRKGYDKEQEKGTDF
jgi:hypothetical protein